MYKHASNLSRHKKSCAVGNPAGALPLMPILDRVMSAALRALREETAAADLPPAPATAGAAVAPAAAAAPPAIGTINVSNTTNTYVNIFAAPHAFGEEDTTYLKEELGALFDSMPPGAPGETIISAVSRVLWGNPNHPRNRNIVIMNRRDNVPMVWTPRGWEPRSEIEIYPQMVGRTCHEIEKAQEHSLMETPEGYRRLERRSAHVRRAFDAEKDVVASLMRSQAALRPILQANGDAMRDLLQARGQHLPAPPAAAVLPPLPAAALPPLPAPPAASPAAPAALLLSPRPPTAP